jgi:hypothetical protein
MRLLLNLRLIALAQASLTFTALADDVNIGAVDREKPPATKDLAVPNEKEAKDVAKVSLRSSVTAERKLKKGKNVYVLVNPLSNATTSKNSWWVQEPVTSDGDRIKATCQFGEPEGGAGEFFAIVVFETDDEYETGKMLQGLPDGKAWSKFKVVQRE